jgi:hypothetical protein
MFRGLARAEHGLGHGADFAGFGDILAAVTTPAGKQVSRPNII